MLVTPTYYGKHAVDYINFIIDSPDYPAEKLIPFLRTVSGVYHKRIEELKEVKSVFDFPVNCDPNITSNDVEKLKICCEVLGQIMPIDQRDDNKDLDNHYFLGIKALVNIIDTTLEHEQSQLNAINHKLSELLGDTNH